MLPRPAAGGEDASDHCESEPQAAQADSDRPAVATERAEASAPRQMQGVATTVWSPAEEEPSCSGAASPVEEDERSTTPQWLRLAAQVLPADASASPNTQAAHETAVVALAAVAQAAVVNEAAASASFEAARSEAARAQARTSPTGVMERVEAEAAAEEAVKVVVALT